MKKFYACLLGNWVCLNDDPECRIGDEKKFPSEWFEENAPVYAPFQRETEDSYYELDYVKIRYLGKTYRINPVFLQVVYE